MALSKFRTVELSIAVASGRGFRPSLPVEAGSDVTTGDRKE